MTDPLLLQRFYPAVSRAKPHATGTPRLKVTIRLDADLRSTRIQVIGLVTQNNLQALYAVTRRANTIQPGMSILIDLSRARIKDEALADLHHVARSHRLPKKLDPQSDRCRIQIVEPTAA